MDPATNAVDTEPKENTGEFPIGRKSWAVRLGAVLWLLVCGWALYGLHREWSGFHLEDLNIALAQIGPGHLMLALTFTVLSYLANAALGLVAQIWLGHRIEHPWRDWVVSCISSAFTMNAGGTVLGGGSIRMRFAAAHGMSVGDVGKTTLFTGLAGWAGHLLVCGVLLTLTPPPMDWLNPNVAMALGVLLTIVSTAAIFGRLVWRGQWPSPRLALLTIAISAIDWICAGLAMWALVPGAVPFGVGAFVAVVVLAQAVAAFTHVPGGVGVLEFTVTKALASSIAAPVLAGALVTYRLIYYLLPFFVAIAVLGARELLLRKARIGKGSKVLMRGWSTIAPRLASLLALGGGFMLLLSANTPIEPSRRAGLEEWVPLPFVEGSHFVSSLAGALLILLARGLQRRIQTAWWLTVFLMAGAVVFSLLKGFDWEEALVLVFMLACLVPERKHFHRHAALWTHRFTAGWWMLLLALTGAALWLGFFAARNVPYERDLWWQFTLEGDASRFLRATVGTGCVILIIALAQALRPARAHRAAKSEPSAVVRLVETSSHSDAALAYLGDKDFTISGDGRSGLMHADQGRSRIVMGDPLGDSDSADDLLWRFVEQAQNEGMRPVFYQISVTEMPRLVDMGFKLYKLGEEGHVALQHFSLDGSEARKMRQARSRFQRSGLVFSIWDQVTVGQRLKTLRDISDVWLDGHDAGEKGFSLGRFEDEYVKKFPCAVMQTTAGETVAFCTIWASGNKMELSVDLMRHLPSAPNGVMEAMFIELMLWGHAQGYQSFNLGMAPLSGLSTHPLAPLWHKLATRVFHRGESFYNFQGLRSYKDKFMPEWEPRYIAVPSTWSLPAALLDATALIGGGLRATFSSQKEKVR